MRVGVGCSPPGGSRLTSWSDNFLMGTSAHSYLIITGSSPQLPPEQAQVVGRGSSWWDLVLGSESLPSSLSSLSAHSSVLSGGLLGSVHLRVCMSGVSMSGVSVFVCA